MTELGWLLLAYLRVVCEWKRRWGEEEGVRMMRWEREEKEARRVVEAKEERR